MINHKCSRDLAAGALSWIYIARRITDRFVRQDLQPRKHVSHTTYVHRTKLGREKKEIDGSARVLAAGKRTEDAGFAETEIEAWDFRVREQKFYG